MRTPEVTSALKQALSLFRQERWAESAEASLRVLHLSPGDANGRRLLAAAAARASLHELTVISIGALRRAGAFSEALFLAQGAVREWPERPDVWNRLGNLQQTVGHLSDAEASYLRALETGATDPRLKRSLGVCLARQDRADEAASWTRAACEADPLDAELAWADARVLPITYETMEEVAAWRSRYLEGLQRTLALVESRPSASLLGRAQDAFHSHYPCTGDDRDLQRCFGAIYDRLAGQLKSAAVPSGASGGRIRVGFVSAFFREHTISRLFGRWPAALPRERFEVHVWQVGPGDARTQELLRSVEHGFIVDGGDAAALGARIRAREMDVLIYPEVGMDIPTLRLAAQRLAPVQAASWGHPVTTALSSIDYFLSSEWMEPEKGQQHYSEQLVRLAGLGAAPEAPKPAPRLRGRADFGLPMDGTVLLNTQSIFKLLPRGDAVFAEIAARAENACVVFLAGDGVAGGERFRARVRRAFQAAGLDPAARLRFIGPLTHDDFLDLNACADIFLDGLDWSGGWTTIEALSVGLVPVTTLGDRMRTRHTAAILHALGADELVTTSTDEYIERAVWLASDAELRSQLAQRLRGALSAVLTDAWRSDALVNWVASTAAR